MKFYEYDTIMTTHKDDIKTIINQKSKEGWSLDKMIPNSDGFLIIIKRDNPALEEKIARQQLLCD